MSASTVDVEARGPIAIVTLNRPESANTLNLRMGMDLLGAKDAKLNPSANRLPRLGQGRYKS